MVLYKACDKNFQTDEDEDGTAEDTGFARELGADLFADLDTAKTDHEGYGGDQKRTEERFAEIVVRDRKADGERVDGGRNALDDQRAEGDRAAILLTAIALEAVDQHFRTDIAEKRECDPRNKLFKSGEMLYDRVDAYPSDQRHERLKESEHTGDKHRFAEFHFRLVESVCQRNGKSVHGESHAEHNAEKEKFPSEIHLKRPPAALPPFHDRKLLKFDLAVRMTVVRAKRR